METLIAFIPILSLFFYIAPCVFVIWFLLRILKIQQEKLRVLRSIDNKLNK
ncbi:hypothetical protein JOC25_001422 [Solibacillus kalamii]|nr:hypothetical protein [Solibacillus kalamii]